MVGRQAGARRGGTFLDRSCKYNGMADPRDHDEFVMQLIESQGRLYAYILSLLLDKARARDLLQQTNLTLLQKEGDYEPGTNFLAWAHRIAFYEVLTDRRNRQRDKHLFSDELLALIATQASKKNESLEDRSRALEHCLESLPESQRKLVVERYDADGGVAALAAKLNKTPAAISAALYRIRSALTECVERKLASAGAQ